MKIEWIGRRPNLWDLLLRRRSSCWCCCWDLRFVSGPTVLCWTVCCAWDGDTSSTNIIKKKHPPFHPKILESKGKERDEMRVSEVVSLEAPVSKNKPMTQNLKETIRHVRQCSSFFLPTFRSGFEEVPRALLTTPSPRQASPIASTFLLAGYLVLSHTFYHRR